VCCGSCGLTDTEIAIIVCISVIGLSLIIGPVVCYKRKTCCFKEKAEVANVMAPAVVPATIKEESCLKEGEVANLMAPNEGATTV